MKILTYTSLILMTMFSSCHKPTKISTMNIDKLYAWCIVPYDKLERTPTQRIDMLKRLNIDKYAYDWREKNLEEMGEELNLAKASGIDVLAVWMWIDNNQDSIDNLSHGNQQMLNILKDIGYKGDIWLSFHANFYENMSDDEAVQKGTEMVQLVCKRAKSMGCKVGLYNHGDWFGEPSNQIKIIKNIPEYELGIIYNFHHAHLQIDAYPKMVDQMMPYLWSVNINGIVEGGPKILPVGAGDREKSMIDLLLEKGYKGDFGILGHDEDVDVEVQLQSNIDGIRKLYNL